ncbi:hypothetical protein [Achromobacter aegrifaciens]|uniref:hypothetical protein n=1 Tax=Achromobacter aegrifaciens TaxID=1287736 RepID=UPI0028B020D0|nr:hypothetical protein [Achromobacter aegrifaciens]
MKVLRALKASETWFALGERLYTWGPVTAAILTTGWASFVTGKMTPWINAIGPVALVGCTLLGMMLAALSYLWWAMARLRHARAAVAFRAAKAEEVLINPLENRFISRRIKLDAFLPPVPERVTGKTFSDCDLMGPIVLAVLDGTTIAHSSFKNCDFVLARRGCTPHNALAFGEMFFTQCRFINITFLVAPEIAHLFGEGANWITDPLTTKTS